MSLNLMLVPTYNSQVADRTADSTLLDQNSVVQKIYDVFSFIYLLQSRLAVIKTKLKQANEVKRINQTNLEEATRIIKTYNDQLVELWSAVENFEMRIQNKKKMVFNILVPELLYQEHVFSPVSGFIGYKNQITEVCEKLAPCYIFQMELTLEREELELSLLQKQNEMIELIEEIGDKMEQAELEIHHRQIKRNSKRILNTKIGQYIINCLLRKSAVNFEENPDLLDLKVKWRY